MLVVVMLISTAAYVLLAAAAAVVHHRGARADWQGRGPARPATIIVAARDEESRIRSCLDSLVAQEDSSNGLRILIVDDDSSDATAEIVEEYSRRDSRITLLRSADFEVPPGKASALAIGVEHAPTDVIVTTDADCLPPAGWTAAMVDILDERGLDVVGGPTLLRGRSLVDRIQQLDWMILFSVASAASDLGTPITAMGNNMAFRRDAYDEVGGYRAAASSPTEDYALFRAISRSGRRSRLVADPRLAIPTEPEATLLRAFRQRRRWARGGLRASPTAYTVYLIGWLTHIIPVLSIIVEPIAAGICLAVKSAADLALIAAYGRRVRAEVPWGAFVAFEVFLTAYVALMPVSLMLAPRLRWKGRRI